MVALGAIFFQGKEGANGKSFISSAPSAPPSIGLSLTYYLSNKFVEGELSASCLSRTDTAIHPLTFMPHFPIGLDAYLRPYQVNSIIQPPWRLLFGQMIDAT